MAAAPANVQALYADLVVSQAKVISVSASALELAESYQQRGILTAYEQIKDKTLPERLAFYRSQAQAFHQRLGLPVPQPVEPDTLYAPAINDEEQRREP
jgi:hypothetical protein